MAFSTALSYAPRLKSLVLTKVARPDDEDMAQIAARIFCENPNLSHLTLKYAGQWHWREDIKYTQIDTYEVASEEQGMPVSLAVRELRVRRRGQLHSRQYRYDLLAQPPITAEDPMRRIAGQFLLQK